MSGWRCGSGGRCGGWTGRERNAASAQRNRTEDVAQACATWHTDAAGVSGIAPERLVFINESAVLTNMARRYGWSLRGLRAPKVPFGNRKRLSVLGAISLDGMVAAMSVEAATDSAVFVAYLDEVLLPKL